MGWPLSYDSGTFCAIYFDMNLLDDLIEIRRTTKNPAALQSELADKQIFILNNSDKLMVYRGMECEDVPAFHPCYNELLKIAHHSLS